VPDSGREASRPYTRDHRADEFWWYRENRKFGKFVIPAEAGIRLFQVVPDPGFRRGDGPADFLRAHQYYWNHKAMLKVEGLSVFYGDYQAVKGISFEVGRGELVTFIGANGAGKTSTIRALLGLVERVKGRIRFDGRDVSQAPSHVRVQEGMRMIPEGRKIFPELTVAQNLRIGAYFIKDISRLEKNRQWVYSLFPVLSQRENQLGRSLSGGEQQMLAIGRALMGEPKLLLIDEVSMGLMPIFVDRVFELIKKIHSEGMTVLLVEQNAKKALGVADRGYVLETGAITLQDTAANLEKNPQIVSAYLGGK